MTLRLLARLSGDGEPTSLAEHRSVYPAPAPLTGSPLPALIGTVEKAGLRGRGGAGFPTGKKQRAVADRRGPRIVLANGSEGEPASHKDRLLMWRQPHLVLDGAVWAAAAVGASEVRVGVDRGDSGAFNAMRSAIAERTAREPSSVPVQLFGTPSRFVTGEERALVHWMNGGPGVPKPSPSRPFEKGVSGRPTLVQNVETLAHMAQIAVFGAGWFRALGTGDEPGTRLATVTGAVARPGVVELPVGAPISAWLEAAGGPTEELSAALVGGFYGTWLSCADFGVPFSHVGLAPRGASPGSGVLVALPAGACGLAETSRVLSWFASESTGQCGPCVFGLAHVANHFATVVAGRGSQHDLANVVRWAGLIEGRGGCRHPDGAVRLLRSALAAFGDDAARHAVGDPCPGSQRTVLPVPVPPRTWR